MSQVGPGGSAPKDDAFEFRRRTIGIPSKSMKISAVKRGLQTSMKNNILKQKSSQAELKNAALLEEKEELLEDEIDHSTKTPTFLIQKLSFKKAEKVANPENEVINTNLKKPCKGLEFDELDSGARLAKLQELWKEQLLKPVLKQLESLKYENDLLKESIESKKIEEADSRSYLERLENELLKRKRINSNLENEISRISEDLDTQNQKVQELSHELKTLKSQLLEKNKSVKNSWKLRDELWEGVKKHETYSNWKGYQSKQNIFGKSETLSEFFGESLKSLSKLTSPQLDESENSWSSQFTDFLDLLTTTSVAINQFKQKDAEISSLESSVSMLNEKIAHFSELNNMIALSKKEIEDAYALERSEHSRTKDTLFEMENKLKELEHLNDSVPEIEPKIQNQRSRLSKKSVSLFDEFDSMSKTVKEENQTLKIQNAKLELYLHKNLSNKLEMQSKIEQLSALMSNMVAPNPNLINSAAIKPMHPQNKRDLFSNTPQSQIIALNATIKRLTSFNSKLEQDLRKTSLQKAKILSSNICLQSKIDEQEVALSHLKTKVYELELKIETRDMEEKLKEFGNIDPESLKHGKSSEQDTKNVKKKISKDFAFTPKSEKRHAISGVSKTTQSPKLKSKRISIKKCMETDPILETAKSHHSEDKTISNMNSVLFESKKASSNNSEDNRSSLNSVCSDKTLSGSPKSLKHRPSKNNVLTPNFSEYKKEFLKNTPQRQNTITSKRSRLKETSLASSNPFISGIEGLGVLNPKNKLLKASSTKNKKTKTKLESAITGSDNSVDDKSPIDRIDLSKKNFEQNSCNQQ
ncbi:hypothetical protein BB560_002347 [Smittium megazygosporum]|uniref:Uncharacterized protein n=1 Tax=Smittium megazygosporum TaxID=133381 RepID=A0A2T9ZF20_9FUNG|nr:hypothetical protein BB560_002347 [Smittium megazygosporum]